MTPGTNLEWMMLLATKLLNVAMAYPPYYGDKSDSREARAELYQPTVVAIAWSVNNWGDAALLLSQAINETHLARYVLEGRCLDGPPGQRCDNGRSHGPFQVNVKWCPSTDFRVQARCALRAARGGVMRCKEHALSPHHAAFAGLAARPCNWPGSDRRVRMMREIVQKLSAE